MVKDNYACAYREVIEVLRYTAQEDVDRIPSEKIKLWLDNMKEDYDFKIDPEKSLSEQNISKEAKAILANIFKQYWATPYQRERIEAKEKQDIERLEEEKRQAYNSDDIFKKKQSTEEDKEIKNIENYSEKLPIEIKKETFFKKLISFIKGLFKKTN